MFPNTRRYVLIIILLLVAVGLTWGQRLSSAARLSAGLPAAANSAAQETTDGVPPAPEHTYFLDVEGWYRITPYETVVRSHVDLTGDTSEAIASAVPAALGSWQQVGSDEYIGDDPAVVYYLKHPTVALQRTYQDSAGQRLTLTILGNRGEDSFLLFSHTPETCYPGRLWQVVESRQESAPLGAPGQEGDSSLMYAQYLLTQHAETGERLMVLFWYLWNDPQRESDDGVLSMRVNLFIPPDLTEEAALARAWDFVRVLFPSTVPWERF
jgi:hypothetical protein